MRDLVIGLARMVSFFRNPSYTYTCAHEQTLAFIVLFFSSSILGTPSLSGSVDRKELRAAFNYLKLELPDSHFEALFRYLDESGNGIVEASELENALRHHRRFVRFCSCLRTASFRFLINPHHMKTIKALALPPPLFSLSPPLFLLRFHFCRSLVEKHEASAREAARLRSADATTNRAATAPGGGTPGANSRPATSSSNDNGGNNVESGTGFPLMSPMKGSTGIGRGQSYNDDSLGGGEGGGLGETFGASGAATGGAVLQNGGIGLSDYRRSPALGRLVTTYPADYPAPGPVLKVSFFDRAFFFYYIRFFPFTNALNSNCSTVSSFSFELH